MAKKRNPTKTLKKQPRQERSKQTVTAIFEATAHILAHSGSDAISTNKVAEKAGVSIGSLYQYFPNKDSIFAGLIDFHLEKAAAKSRRVLEENENLGAEETIEIFINHLVDTFYANRKFLAQLFAQAPNLKKTRDILYRRNRNALMVVEFLEKKSQHLRSPETLQVQMNVLTNAVLGTIQSAILEDFETLTVAVLKRELTEICRHYLLLEIAP